MYRFDDCVVDPRRFQVWKAGTIVALEPKAIRVLHFLVENRGRLVSKEELMQSVWGETFVTDNALTRVVAQLRKALGDNARQARYIETVPTQGYRFIAPVTEAVDETVEESPEPPVVVPAAIPVTPLRSRTRVLIAALVIVAAMLAGWWWRGRSAAVSAWRGPRAKSVQFTTSGGLDVTPAFSPDGNLVAYASDKSGSFEIYVRPVEPGGREVQVTRDAGQNVQPTWSPDGRTIAYYGARQRGIYLVPALGGFPKQLTTFGCEPRWSPDGKWIAFRSGGFVSLVPPDTAPPLGSRLWLVPASGGQPRQLTDSTAPSGTHGMASWSPDGSRVVFLSFQPQAAVLSVATADGKLAPPLKSTRAGHTSPVFSPDGRWIYSGCLLTQATEFGICRTPVSGGETSEIFWTGMMLPRDLTVSPDGRRLAYSLAMMSSNLWSMPITPDGRSNGAPAILIDDSSHRNTFPAISPDGKHIAFNARRRGAFADIFVMGPDGHREQLTNHVATDIMPSWSPDGKAIFFTSARNGHTQLWRISLADGSETVVPTTSAVKMMARISPDGRWALYHQTDDWRLSTWKTSLDTGQRVRMTPSGESMGYPNWSRDGKWIALERVDLDSTEVGIIPFEGGAYRKLTKSPGLNWAHSWSPDSSKVAVAALRDGLWNLWWVGLNGEERRLTDYRSLRAYVRYPEWSPTGERVVFEYAEARGNVYLLDLVP
jgi:Tol biopolymer transport system component/DNA-binding winged helix-turn-helix (wHTH) protein